MIHEFVLQRYPISLTGDDDNNDDNNDDDNDDNNDDDNDDSDRCEVQQGENWLRLLPKEGHSVLDDTQTQSQDTSHHSLYPSIVSLSSVGVLDAPSNDYYICVDLDGDTLTIKDMRLPPPRTYDEEEEEEDEQEAKRLGIARNGKPSESWELLPRRQLRVLHPGDRLCTSLSSVSSESAPGGLVLEYKFSTERPTAVSVLEKESPPMEASLGMLTQPPQEEDAMSVEVGTPQMEEMPSPSPVVKSSSSEKKRSELVVEEEQQQDDDFSKTPTDDDQPCPVKNGTGLMEEKDDASEAASAAATEDSDRTLDMEDMTQTQSVVVSSTPAATTILLCTQPNEDSSDEETTLGGDQDDPDTAQKAVETAEPKKDGWDGTGAKDNYKVLLTIVEEGNATKENLKPFLGQDEGKAEAMPCDEEASGAMEEDTKNDQIQPSLEPPVIEVDGATAQDKVPSQEEDDDNELKKGSDSHKESDEIDNKGNAQPESGITMSPALCADTQDPPVSENDKASQQSSGAISATLLCETGEEKPSLSASQAKGSDVTPTKKDIERGDGTELAKPTLHKDQSVSNDDDDEVTDPDSPPVRNEPTRGDDEDLTSPLEDNDDDDDSATQLSEVLPSKPIDESTAEPAESSGKPAVLELSMGTSSQPDEKEVVESTSFTNNDSSEIDVENAEGSDAIAASGSMQKTTTDDAVMQQMETPKPDSLRAKRKRSPANDGGDSATKDNDVVIEQQDSASKRSRRGTPSRDSSTPKRLSSPIEPNSESRTKRKRSASPGIKSDFKSSNTSIRVMTTGIELSSAQKHMVKRIGGVLLEKVDDASTATHVIAGSQGTTLRRTPKLMIGLSKTSNVVNLDWLLESAKDRKALPSKKFLLVDDGEAEANYDFRMRETLMRAGRMRSSGKSLLGRYSVFVCPGAAGNKSKNNRTPPIEEFRLILEAAGATWLSSLPSNTKSLPSTIVIVSKVAGEAKKQLSAKKVAETLKKGAISKTTEEMFHGIMTQKFETSIFPVSS